MGVSNLAVAAVRDVALLPAEPVAAERRALELVRLVAARAQATALPAGRGQPAELAVLLMLAGNAFRGANGWNDVEEVCLWSPNFTLPEMRVR